MQGAAALDVRLDVEDQFLHRRVIVAVADDAEGLHQRDARGHHRGQLATEQRDVLGLDLAAAAEELEFARDLAGEDAAAPQLRAQRLLVHRQVLALDAVAALVRALPLEGGVLADRLVCLAGNCVGHGSVLSQSSRC